MTEASEGPGRKTGNYGRFFAQAPVDGPLTPVDARLAALAARQHGVLDLTDLRSHGLSEDNARKRVAGGRLHRIYAGVYSLAPPALLSRRGRWLAAVRAGGPGAVLSHRAGAVLHDIHAPAAGPIDVTVPGLSHRRRPGIKLHRSVTLTAEDCVEVDGIPVTSISRTLLDLAGLVPRRALERAFDQAEIQHQLSLSKLQDQLGRNPTRAGVGTLRAVLADSTAANPTEGELEERFLALIRRERLPAPEVQAHLVLGELTIRADFLWRAQRLVVETDGHATHRTRQAADRDSDRDQRLLLAGWRSIRVRWRQLTQRPEEITARLRLLLG